VLLHELQVHQIELELQNDELRRARGELALALSRYTELFDFAPIGYATVQAAQTIQDINHAGCQLLGRARSVLRGWRVEQLVPVEHRIGLRSLLLAAEASGVRESSMLELVRAGGGSFPARISATVLLRAAPKILLAFKDISELEQREMPWSTPSAPCARPTAARMSFGSRTTARADWSWRRSSTPTP
jgi:PAS domain S-box-containing protein